MLVSKYPVKQFNRDLDNEKLFERSERIARPQTARAGFNTLQSKLCDFIVPRPNF